MKEAFPQRTITDRPHRAQQEGRALVIRALSRPPRGAISGPASAGPPLRALQGPAGRIVPTPLPNVLSAAL
jgi:hypothetical protein